MKNKRILIPLIYLIIALTGWSGGLFIVAKHSAKKESFDRSRFENVIGKYQKILKDDVSFIADEYFSEGKGLPEIMDTLAGRQTSYLVYDADTLIAWSDASAPVYGERDSLMTQHVVHLKNGWYLTEKKEYEDLIIVGLFKIKQQFPYENKFLKNKFNKQFRLKIVPDIKKNVPDEGIPIHDDEGRYLFSLIIHQNSSVSPASVIMMLVFIIIAIAGSILFACSVHTILNKRFGNYSFYFYAFILFLIFWGFIKFNALYLSGMNELFSSVLFAYPSWFPSLVSMLLLAFLLNVFWFRFYRLYNTPALVVRHGSDIRKMAVFFVTATVLVLLYLIFINRLIVILVQHSPSLSLYHSIIDFDISAVVKVVIVVFLLSSSLLFLEKTITMFSPYVKIKTQFITVIFVPALFFLLRYITGSVVLPEGFAFFSLVSLSLLLFGKGKTVIHSYEVLTWIIFLFSIYVSVVLIRLYAEKEKKIREVLIENLSFRLVKEEDPVAEMYLKGLESAIENDNNLRQMLKEDELSPEQISGYLEKKYFVGYLSRYELQVVPCWPGGDLVIRGTGERYNCYNYFDEMIAKMGENIQGSRHFYFIDNDNGNVTYLGLLSFFNEDPRYKVNLYIEINSKPVFVGLGYPELLKSNKERKIFEVEGEYSFAKYVNGVLAKEQGDYDYEVSSKHFEKDKGQKYYVETDGVSHLVYRPEPNVLIVLSHPKLYLYDIVIGFSIFFIAFFLLTLSSILIIKFKSGVPFFRFTIRERIQIALVSIVLVLLLIIGASSVFYSIYQFKKKNSVILSERLKSVLMEVEQELAQKDTVAWNEHDYLQPLLQKYSNVFFCDINLFTLNGHLLASSRPELYMKGLTSRLMSPRAFYEMSVNKRTEYEQEESIGSLKYVSAYEMVLNNENKPLAYLNIPYFVGSDELREQVSSLVVAVINAYLIFVLFAIGFAVFIAKRITLPLSTIQNRLEKISLSKKNEKIGYKRKDEIGELVAVYNRMVDELAKSANKLAQSEREVAWREMAKQIAHEIKNPLTPMRLNIQYLQKAKKDNVEDFDTYLEKVTNSLLEQIDQLSVIATEFSNFAKMPVAKRSRIDLMSKLKNVCDLFREIPVFEIIEDFDPEKPVWVYADPDQMVSVFNNIIKNAVQSIPKNRKGILKIRVETGNGKVKLTFADNGAGMSHEVKEKIFQPNFTTKGSGMGLGLAIVKNIIANSKGKIWFETEKGKGTTFYIELPLYE